MKCVLADAPETIGLVLTAVAGDQRIPTAPNSPIWIDLTVTNAGLLPFDGMYHDRIGYGTVATTSTVTDFVKQKCIDGCRSGAANELVLDAGKTKVFHIVLNDTLPVIKPGTLSGWIVLPLCYLPESKLVNFTLVAPFSVKIGPPLTQEELTSASNVLFEDIMAGGGDLHDQALQSLNVLPDHYAVQILARAIKKLAPWGRA